MSQPYQSDPPLVLAPVGLDPVELDTEASEAFTYLGRSSGLTCPECHGGIFELAAEQGGVPKYRCRVGHAFSTETLFEAQRSSLEAALWMGLRALEESAELVRRMAVRARARDAVRAANAYARDAVVYEERATVIRDVLRAGLPAHAAAGSPMSGKEDLDD